MADNRAGRPRASPETRPAERARRKVRVREDESKFATTQLRKASGMFKREPATTEASSDP